MKKTLVAAVLSALLAGWLFACVQGWVVPRRSTQQGLRIGFVLSTMQEERYQKDRAAFDQRVRDLGGTMVFNDAKNDGQIQVQVVQEILARGVTVMVIQPVNSDTAKNLVDLCHQRNVPVIAYDRVIKNCPLDMYVTMDSYKVGMLQAQAAVKATGGRGRYVILKGTVGHSVADEITRGVKDVLKNYPDVQIVAEQNHPNWAPDEGLVTTENVLTREQNKVDAILCNNSGMARGAIQALRKVGLEGKVFVAGADADLDNVRYVLQGVQSVEVLKGVVPLAQAAADAAVALAKGANPLELAKQFAGPAAANDPKLYTYNNGAVEVPTINTAVELVTKDNVEKVIIESGFHPRSEFEGLLK